MAMIFEKFLAFLRGEDQEETELFEVNQIPPSVYFDRPKSTWTTH